ncbi:MAG: LD-carboxypeptidase [Desulforhopalus sp.]|nr:LD-carboxypeptidase [Desulforhopalus sp.]
MKPSLVPLPLKRGDTLGIIAPAGRLTDVDRFHRGVAVLREMGFDVRYPRDLWPGLDHLADTDGNRCAEFNELLQDSEVKALIALRGGYGCLRMMDEINLAATTTFKKLVIGFSDITLLLNYLYQKTGLIGLHGPVVTSLGDVDSISLERLFLCLTGRWSEPVRAREIELVRDGPVATGPLVGGNLASLVSVIGTPFDFSWDNKIVFLEDINEPAYKIDRMLTQLYLAGKFARVAGIILGGFSGLFSSDKVQQDRYMEGIWKRVLELCGDRNITVWGNFPCGHAARNLTLPLGALAQMQSSKSRLVFPEPRSGNVI